MKDIYELFNEIEVTEEEMEEFPVTQTELAQVKRKLKKNINCNKKFYQRKGFFAAAICCAVLGGTTIMGVINPALAADIPVVGDIFRFLDNGRTGNYVLYKQYSDEMNLTSTDNGVAITIEDALFDGRNIYYTYRIETDKDLGESPNINDSNFEVQDYEEGMSGDSQVRKVKDNVYVGQDSWTLHEEKDKVNIKIKIKSIYYQLEQEQEGAKLKGNWQFKFALNAAKGEKTAINQSVEAQDIKITVESITKTPMSCILNYSQFLPQKYISPVNRRYLGIEMKVKDDLGNEYKADGASSFSLGSKPGINYYTQTVGKLDENATKLILTPELTLPLGGGGAAIAEDGTETEINQEMPGEIKGLETIKFDDIVLELN